MKGSVLKRVGVVIGAVLVLHVLARVIYRNIMLRAASQVGLPETSWSYFDWSLGSVLASHSLAFVTLVWLAFSVKGVRHAAVWLDSKWSDSR